MNIACYLVAYMYMYWSDQSHESFMPHLTVPVMSFIFVDNDGRNTTQAHAHHMYCATEHIVFSPGLLMPLLQTTS